MRVFLATLEGNSYMPPFRDPKDKKKPLKMNYNLMSYYAIRGGEKKRKFVEHVRDHTKLILIDSGAHSFQKGKIVDWEKYTDEYARFIQEFDRKNVIGYFEMDVDKIIGYENVLRLRRKLKEVTGKIIPVWHRGRGVHEYEEMCKTHSGRAVAISGFKNEDIRDSQFLSFLKVARKYHCWLHCLGMTRMEILDRVPFDSVDSSSWKQGIRYANLMGGLRPNSRFLRTKEGLYISTERQYLYWMKIQEKYQMKWRKEECELPKNCEELFL